MRRLLVVVMLILATGSLTVSVLAAVADSDYFKFLDNLDADRVWRTVNDLAGDRFEGRRTGAHGADLASDYIATYFGSIGLRPAGSDGDYRAPFNVTLCQPKHLPTLALVDAGDNILRAFEYKKDFYLRQCSGGGNYSGDAVFAGYGVTAKNLGYDDYAAISAKGKFVLVIIGAPPSDKFSKGNYANVYTKADNAMSHGAVGLIVVDSPANPSENYIELWSGGWWVAGGFTLLRASIGMADLLLSDENMTLSSVQKQIDQNLKPQSFALDKRLRISADVTYNDKATGYNVLGYISGSGPEALKKVVIIGAHYDHGGRDADASILRGANDDASGTAVMMEIARIFAAGVRPKWSVLFAAWGGEEEGLVGSEAYVDHPYFLLGGTRAYLNLDMVGGDGGLQCQISQTNKNLFTVMDESRQELNVSLSVESVVADSDHWSFEDRSVPSLMLIYWPDSVYHTSRDTIDHVSKQKLLETAKLTSLMALKLSEATVTTMTLTTVVMTATSVYSSSIVTTESTAATTVRTTVPTTWKTTVVRETGSATTPQGALAGGFAIEILIIAVGLIVVGSVAAVYFRRRNK